jgi:hypothetical protein
MFSIDAIHHHLISREESHSNAFKLPCCFLCGICLRGCNIRGSFILNNTAEIYGGGMSFDDATYLRAHLTTLSGNRASGNNGQGGGLTLLTSTQVSFTTRSAFPHYQVQYWVERIVNHLHVYVGVASCNFRV